MAIKDEIKWNKKYKENPKLLQDRDASKKLQEIINLTSGKNALEIACGSGRNSIYLANQGFQVSALDISKVAIDRLEEKNHKNIKTQVIDLEGYKPEENSFDLIVKTNYLDRDIIFNLAKALKQKGILFIETYMDDKENNKPNSNPNFLLKKNELKTFFNKNYEILDYQEFDNKKNELYRMKKQAIVVRKL